MEEGSALIEELIRSVGHRVQRVRLMALSQLNPESPRRAQRTDATLRKLRPMGSFATVVGTTVAVVSFLSHIIAPAPSAPVPVPALAVTYLVDELRPSLEEPSADFVPSPARYVVEEGDTLLAVAFKFGSTVEAIRLASSLKSADLLTIGQELVIPPARSVLQPVDPFMTPREIAEQVKADPGVIAFYNGMPPDHLDVPLARPVAVLPPGGEESSTRLVASARGQSTSSAATRATVPALSVAPMEATTTTYTVQEGDTINSIASRLGVTPGSLAATNSLSNRDLIRVGDELTVKMWTRPATESEPALAEGDAIVRATSLTAGSSAPVRPRGPIVYDIEPGDTIGAIAERFGVDPTTIVSTNELRDANVLRVGDQLTILPVTGVMYTVRPGDTLASIAERYQVDLGPIIDFNYLDDLDTVAVGQELILPGAKPLPAAPPPPTLPTNYTVQEGDSVGSVARRFGVSSADIIAANNLRNADRISIGDTLRIVAGAAEAAAQRPSAPTQPSTARQQPPRPQQQQTVTRNLPVPQPSAPAQALAPSIGGGSLVSIAMQYLGHRYVFGGTTPAGFDCSGFVYYVHQRAGKPISRAMWGQYNAGPHPSRAELQPGDIVFFQNTYMAGLSHNGIYIGNGQFVHASDERNGVKVSSLSEAYWASRWFGATRVQ